MSAYADLIAAVFLRHYVEGEYEFFWKKDEFEEEAAKRGITLPRNIPDVIYTFRHRREMPSEIQELAPEGKEWIIVGAGISKYKFVLTTKSRTIPRPDLRPIDIPDATPDIVQYYSQGDEQALLTILRYNRVVDIFCEVTAYSLQNHLRTTVEGVGQIEIDEIYLGLNKLGERFVIPVQAKGGTDQLGVVQTLQDIAYCKSAFPELNYKAISVQFVKKHVIAMFQLDVENGSVVVIDEKHYRILQYDAPKFS